MSKTKAEEHTKKWAKTISKFDELAGAASSMGHDEDIEDIEKAQEILRNVVRSLEKVISWGSY